MNLDLPKSNKIIFNKVFLFFKIKLTKQILKCGNTSLAQASWNELLQHRQLDNSGHLKYSNFFVRFFCTFKELELEKKQI